MDPGSSSLDPLPEGIPSNAMTPEQKEGRLADGDCGDGQDHGDANIQWHKLSFKELTWVQLYTQTHESCDMTNDKEILIYGYFPAGGTEKLVWRVAR